MMRKSEQERPKRPLGVQVAGETSREMKRNRVRKRQNGGVIGMQKRSIIELPEE